MTKINVLDKYVAELIAAGEVVERPLSVVKELIENSIDAGATRINIDIKHGGTQFIKISDNGSGILRGDIRNAFLRYATSKVKNEKDLETISTLGFRGEALASVSAVARVEVITCAKEEEVGTRYVIEGGEEKLLEDIGCAQGTTIIVRDLFFNTPARMKFLKKDVIEANSVAGIVDRIAVSHPEIAFKFVRDGKEVLNTPGDGKLSSCIYTVYGKDFFNGMVPVKYGLNGVNVEGFVSKPSAARPNRSMQHFFINGRYVKTRTGCVALEEAFKNSIMVGKHPYCVIYINIPYELVDVNVHPSKVEVKFINERSIFDAVYYGVKNSLMNFDGRKKLEFSINEKLNASEFKVSDTKKSINKSAFDNIICSDNKVKDESNSKVYLNSSYHDSKNFYRLGSEPISETAKEKILSKRLNFDVINVSVQDDAENKPLEKPRDEKNDITDSVQNQNISLSADSDVLNKNEDVKIDDGFSAVSRKIIGEIFNCYVLVQYGEDKIVILDKHAVHERMIYEKLKSEEVIKDSQVLLEPITVVLDKNEYAVVLDNLSIFSNSGYHIEDFGMGSIIVRSIPVYVDIGQVKDSIIEIADYILKNKKNLSTVYMDWLYHNMACRAAIKSGKRSSEEEILDLVDKLEKNSNIKYCPHGRPVSIEMNKKDIEKQFGRT